MSALGRGFSVWFSCSQISPLTRFSSFLLFSPASLSLSASSFPTPSYLFCPQILLCLVWRNLPSSSFGLPTSSWSRQIHFPTTMVFHCHHRLILRFPLNGIGQLPFQLLMPGCKILLLPLLLITAGTKCFFGAPNFFLTFLYIRERLLLKLVGHVPPIIITFFQFF